VKLTSSPPGHKAGRVAFYALLDCYLPRAASARDLRYGPAMAKTPSPKKPPADLLSSLPEPMSAGLFAKARSVKLAADQTLFNAGDAGDGCYRVDQGLLKVSIVSPEGGERILAILGPGAVVGELAMIDGAPRSTGVSAVRDAELSFVSRASFQAFADEHPDLYRHVMLLLAHRLRETNEVVAASTFLSVKGRVARSLLDLAEAFGEDIGTGRTLIRQKVSQGDVAAMAGIARENVSRVLNEWMRAKVLSRHAGYYCIEKRDAITEVAEL
jgi:CRP/FNR family cyclic AMP-dependent transcriptional regulator